MTIEAYDFDIDAYCVVCDRAIPPTSSSSAAQTQPPSAGASSAGAPSKRRDSKSALSTSLRSSDGAASKPMRRGHSSKAVGGTALKRNKSTTKFAAAAHHHRRPLPDRKSVSKPRSVGEIIEIIEIDPDEEEGSVVGESHTALYCSDECRLIDEARNELTLLRMGGSSSVSSFGAGSSLGAVGSLGAFSSATSSPPLQPLASADHRRRRSSGGSSLAADLAFSTLSPIPSAAAGAYDPTIPAFPFPSQSPALALDLGARRTTTRSVGSYSYRPSLMDRVSSSDAVASTNGGGVWLGPDKGFSRSHSAFVDGASHAADRPSSALRRTQPPRHRPRDSPSPQQSDLIFGSAPAPRRGPLATEPASSRLAAPPPRSKSSASLALLGSSFTAGSWLTRADSVTSLSGLTAQGVIASPSLPPVPSASSPSSTSSFDSVFTPASVPSPSGLARQLGAAPKGGVVERERGNRRLFFLSDQEG
ncbi:hypothetical protein C6P46_002215 [Rhodotorula mucilaginosa]|uniref:Uncharacterized protein n=1 Tax=Rhodotorula mucilaginosa TaxID=5537 RepID=A0A9P6VRV6_RHOMI|nr:hypothetical protein C6P46_002215 [Rhodotorula mucilaginosa]